MMIISLTTAAPKAHAVLDCLVNPIPCILQAGGQITSDASSWVETVFNGLKQGALETYEDSHFWFQGNLESIWKGSAINRALQQIKATNLARSVKGNDYSVEVSSMDEKGKTQKTNAGELAKQNAPIEQLAEAKKTELASIKGTLAGMQEEEARKSYVSQHDTIDALAKALVAKQILDEIQQIHAELSVIEAYAVPYGTGEVPPTSARPTIVPAQKGHKDILSALYDNLTARLLLDSLLNMQQQILAIRLKTTSIEGIQEIGHVSNPNWEVQVIDENTTDGSKEKTK